MRNSRATGGGAVSGGNGMYGGEDGTEHGCMAEGGGSIGVKGGGQPISDESGGSGMDTDMPRRHAGEYPAGIVHDGNGDVSTEAVDIFLLIVHLARGLRWHGSQMPEDLRTMVRNAGLAPRHITALVQIAAAGEMSVSLLADRLGVALTTASLLASQLASQGLVERKEDPEDHRRTLIRIPERFDDITSGMFKGLLEPIEQVLASISAQDRGVLESALRKLVEAVTAAACGP
ncbi:MAG: MarR family transcriptional regulator [Actinobacteria bacterium]|nr:MarR family transcriptional regulator [Actinomycetota bacterium]